MKTNLTVLVDGDDTLWKSQEYYDEAKARFASLLLEHGFSDMGEEMIPKLDSIDARRVAARGLTIQRFTESMLILYNYFCNEQGLPYRGCIEREITNLSAIVMRPPEVYEDVPEALEKLNKKFRLILFTAGHPATQQMKLSTLNIDLMKYFEEIRLVNVKSEERLRRELSLIKVLPSEVWSIGNSLRSDILPAIAVGANAILVERGGWLYDMSLSDIHDWRIHFQKADSLLKAADLVLGL